MTAVADSVIDGLDVLICGIDDDGTIHVFNRPCERLTGISRHEAVGLSWLEIFAGQRDEHVQTLWAQARQDAPAGPFEALCRNGRNLRWQFSRHPHTPPPVALWAVGVDVTDERVALVKARELERVVALGNIVSGLTHELRNPLNGALLQLMVVDRALARHGDDWVPPVVNAVMQARSELQRMARLLDDFLVFTRPQPVHLERANLRAIVDSAIARAAPRAAAAAVQVALEPGRDVIAEVDAARVETAVYQLLTNAIDAASNAAERSVRARVELAANAAAIEIIDRGIGELAADGSMFEPFFTTKTGGTGLGLSIVQRVAADHGGTIAHDRRDGSTVFRLELPIVGGAVN